MDQWTKSLREDTKFRHRSKNPSFSSSLLDAIYRSIDEGEEELVLYKETMRKNITTCTTESVVKPVRRDRDKEDYTRACLIEKWMEKKVSEKVVVRRRSEQDFTRSTHKPNVFHSASSSSDSSSAGGFSSSEGESLYGSHRPKPIRTSLPSKPDRFERVSISQLEQRKPSKNYEQKPERGSFNKTKLKAMKLYGDLKKQPISPGGKLASFLNSLFTTGNTKKDKFSTSVNGVEDLRSERKSKSTQTSTCSSASSFSRSCLSKTPSSRGDTKRTVRFYPVSVIVDEENRPCGHKSLPQDHHHQQQHHQQKQQQEQQKKNAFAVNEELKFQLMEKNRKIEEAAREYLYQQKAKTDSEMRDVDQDYEDDDDDDAESYASSDLFELDNFAAIGIERYREELPVYETTHLEKNRAISKSFIL